MNSAPDSPAPHPPGRRLGLGIVLCVLASLAFATSGPFARPLFEAGWSPGATALWRMTGASVLLLPIGLWQLRGRLELLRTEWRTIIAFGSLAVVAAQLMYFLAIARMSVSAALLVEYMAPVALVLLAWARTRHAPPRLVSIGAVISVAGLICVLDVTGARVDPLGLLFAFGAMIGASTYFLLSAHPSSLPPLALAAFGLPVGALTLALLTLTGILPYSAPLVSVELLGATVGWWVPLGVVIVVSTAVAYTVGVAGVALAGERLSSFIGLTEVIFAAILAAVLLGEQPTGWQLLGGVLIITGVVLIRLAAERPNPAPKVETRQPSLEDVG